MQRQTIGGTTGRYGTSVSKECLFRNVPKRLIKIRSVKDTTSKTAEAYNYFFQFLNIQTNTLIDEQFLFCKECLEQWQPDKEPKIAMYGLNTATSNMKRHLFMKHGINLDDKNGKNQLKLPSMFKEQNAKATMNIHTD